MMSIGQTLLSQGHSIIYAGFEPQRQRALSNGFAFAHLTHSQRLFDSSKAPGLGPIIEGVWLSSAAETEIPALVAEYRPDRLIVDCLLFTALTVCEGSDWADRTFILLHSAATALCPPSGDFDHMLSPPLNALREKLGLSTINRLLDCWVFAAAQPGFPSRNLTTSILELDPMPEQLPPGLLNFIGLRLERATASVPDWKDRLPWSIDDPRPLVVASFSTFAPVNQRSRVERVLAGLADVSRYRVLVCTTCTEVKGLEVPANAALVEFIPHSEVLPLASVVISHAGHGTTITALSCSAPLLALPNSLADQPALAQRGVDLGVGLRLDGESATAEQIREAVDRLLTEPAFKLNARKLAAVIQETSAGPLPL